MIKSYLKILFSTFFKKVSGLIPRCGKVLNLLALVSLVITSNLYAADKDTIYPINSLSVSFDLERHLLKGVSEISLPAGQSAVINISGLKILSASINDRDIIIEPGIGTITFAPVDANDILHIGYEAEFKPSENSRYQGSSQVNFISPEGISLTGGWYPFISGLSVYHLTATLSNGFEGISEAEEIIKREKTDGSMEFSFSFSHSLERICFIASRYQIEKDTHNGIDIYTYFLPKDSGLSKTYIGYTKRYLDMYEKMLRKYPFKRFSIVENIFPTGYSMPTFALLGQTVVKLPFIVETSLGHEVLHQWFGNLVYVDYRGGNWSEGLTTYLADHMYEEAKGRGWDYRKQMLITYQSYVTPENELLLKTFSARTDRITNAVGYGKSAMIFHMVKNLVGEDVFYNSLREFIKKNEFKPASWNDIKDAFEIASGKDLDWFFKQWLEEKDAPELDIKDVNLLYRGSKAIVSFTILQKGKNYKLLLPVVLKSREGETRKIFELGKESTTLEIETTDSPVELVIDDNYDLFRRLSEKEFPPVISRLLGGSKRIFVIPKDKEKEYSYATDYMKREGFMVKKEEDIKYDDIKTSSMIIYGSETRLVGRLFGKIEKQQGDIGLVMKENPFNKGVIAIIDGSSPSAIVDYFPKITHYGKYSSLSFKNGETIKTIHDSRRGVVAKVAGDVLGLEIPRIINIKDIIEKVSDKKIIYVGEAHDRFEHHRVQFEIIRALHKKNKKIAIGMEMFQKPSQKALDDYFDGITDEKEFLKKSEYFKHWGIDYNLYREILLYAREYKIPVIALNIRREIVSKVSKNGLYSLTEEELKEVPNEIDLSDSEYGAMLKEYFEKHNDSANKNFDFFYQAQVLWDESMANNLNEFIQKNPDYQVIVIAGGGHMAFGSGIPGRAYRLNKKEYSIILNTGDVEKNIADFVLFPEALTYPESPKLMVQLKEGEKKVKISGFAPDSISEKAGLKKDDIILSLDDTKIEGIDDMKIFLLYKKKNDEIKVKVLRKRFLLGAKEMDFKIVLR